MQRPTAQRNLAAGLLAALLAGAAGCGPPADAAPQRLVGAISADRFRFSEQSIDEVFRWDFADDVALEPWTLRADLGSEIDDGWLHLVGSDRSSLVRDVDFQARDIDRILVRLEGLNQGRTRVYWSAAGDAFSADRQVGLRPSQGTDGLFEFRVGEHPLWSGRIRHFRLDLTNSAHEEVAVESIVGARADLDLSGETYARNWAVEIDNELRAGLIVTSRRPQRRRLPVPRGARLHFATSLLKSPPFGEARFTIARLEGDRRQEIYSRPLPDPVGSSARWAADTVALPSAGDAEVELEFALECPAADDCAGAFASIESRPPEPSPRPNVVLISIDTLRADRMSLYGNRHQTTTRIDRWAADGVVFDQVVAQAPWTLPSHISMFTGLDPLHHNVNYNSAAPETLELLSERLHDAGYFTAAVTGGGYVDPAFGFWQGFDVYRHWERDVASDHPDQSAPGAELDSGLHHAFELLDEIGERPFFLFFHTYEVHGPFHPQEPYFSRFYGQPAEPGLSISNEQLPPTAANGYKTARRMQRQVAGTRTLLRDEELPLARATYDSGVAYTDERIGRLLDRLEATGRLSDTIIVLTSDHGELLGEQGFGGHGYLLEPNLRVPLVISWPEGIAGGRRVDSLARTIDIVPTVLDLLGREVPDGLDGVSLRPRLAGRPVPPVTEAISYAASTNRGVSLRFDSGLLYVYDNSPWRNGQVDRLGPVEPTSPAASMDLTGRAEVLRARVEQLLEDRAGLHLALVNDGGAEDLRVRLRGPAANRGKLKATGIDCACARWLEGGITELRVPPGHRFGLQFEDVVPGILTIELRTAGETYGTTFDVGALDEPVAVDWGPDGWSEGALRQRPVARGFVLWWQGDSRAGGDEPADERLRSQLRALGYLR